MVQKLEENCPIELYNSTINRGSGSIWSTNPKCNAIYDEWLSAMGGYNVYSIYDTCYLRNDNARRFRVNRKGVVPGGTGSYMCGSERAMHVWLNRPEVKSAFHVKQIPWADHDGWSQYIMTAKDLTPT